MKPDLIVEKGKPTRLPALLNHAILTNEYPFPIGVNISHNKWVEPEIILVPVKEENRELGGD